MSDNPPAFPVSSYSYERGMTLLDWFAGQALVGILASGAGEDDCDVLRRIIAVDAYGYAYAMLEARKATQS